VTEIGEPAFVAGVCSIAVIGSAFASFGSAFASIAASIVQIVDANEAVAVTIERIVSSIASIAATIVQIVVAKDAIAAKRKPSRRFEGLGFSGSACRGVGKPLERTDRRL
jgi:hypothetical protein